MSTGLIAAARNEGASWRLRSSLALALVLIFAIISLAYGGAANSQTKSAKRPSANVSPFERELASVINVTRTRYGLRALRLVPGLMLSADKHSLQMVYYGYFAHSSPNGASFMTRVMSYYGANSRYFSAGENLFWAESKVTSREVVARWLASPPHRAVLLSPNWRVFGLGVVRSTHGAGVFKGRTVKIVTADFAVKR